MNIKEQQIQNIKNRNDEYLNTIYAIIGFLNTYKYELDSNGDNLFVFQGRKLFTDEKKENFVTPDLGLVISEKSGLVGEVKYSFPLDQTHWKEIFEQLYKYSIINNGWPTSTGQVENYDVVLLVHQSRSRKVVDYYLKSLPDNLKINKAFAIIEFNRSSQGKEYFHFRIEHGSLSSQKIQDRIYNGLEVPFEVYVTHYSKVKICDVEPHMSFMLYLIYECILDKSKGDGTFKKLTKKAKIPIETSIVEITHILREAYSFKSLQSNKYGDGQPEFPKQDWVRSAIEKLIELAEAFWKDKTKGEFVYYLTPKEGDILEYYILKCVEDLAKQTSMF